jgi:putative ABC transport system permease protein
MNLLESFRIALDGLITNRLRPILTTLGSIIGVGAVYNSVESCEGWLQWPLRLS